MGLVLACSQSVAGNASTRLLFDPTAAGSANRFKVSSGQVTVSASKYTVEPGVVVSVLPADQDYPGVDLKLEPESGWDLSEFGHVEAKITNLGKTGVAVSMRLDNAGDWRNSPWNTEQKFIEPGKTETLKVIFGYAYGYKPDYKLDPSKIINLKLFTGKVREAVQFRIDSIIAAGPASEMPHLQANSIRVAPDFGFLIGGGSGMQSMKQVTSKTGKLTASASGVAISFAADTEERSVIIKPDVGRWDLRRYLQVDLKLKNTGREPIEPRLTLLSNGGSTAAATTAPIAPGATGVLVASFIPTTPWQGPSDIKGKTLEGAGGTKFTSDTVSALVIALPSATTAQSFEIESAIAGVSTSRLPDWLGKRPPVQGDWVETFVDNFDGSVIDQSRWSVVGPNYWDKNSRWSKDNVIIGGGKLRLHYERRTGPHNDEPNGAVKDHSSGYLATYGKWTQKYGYFEARMKLPTAPGLWPAFWMMPDRGVKAGEEWRRQDTTNGGMEFDIMEHLTRWGPYRLNIAMHWDGFGKEHKSTGSSNIYFAPDAEGFVTTGLLWERGKVVYYVNGAEVARWENARISDVPADLMFTLPMGGWDNSPLDDTKLPDDFVIDYVRCWQRKDRKDSLGARQ